MQIHVLIALIFAISLVFSGCTEPLNRARDADDPDAGLENSEDASPGESEGDDSYKSDGDPDIADDEEISEDVGDDATDEEDDSSDGEDEQDIGEEEEEEEEDPLLPPPPRFEVHFNEPSGGNNDDHLEDVLIDLLGKAEPGSTVRAAFYTWSRTRIARAFVNAFDAGVDVRVIVGNTNRHASGEDWEAIKILRAGLGSRLTICSEGQSSGGCIGSGIQHNKFTLFSALNDGSRDVVFQSSANHTAPQRKDFNNAIIIRGDTALYNAYFNYWTDLRAQQRNLNYYRSFDGDHRTKVYFYPRSSGDTIVSILNNITCDNNSYIHIGMAFFSNPRVQIAQTLVSRKSEGCQVRVIADGPEIGNQVLSTLRNAGIEVALFPAGAPHTVHSKYLLINAPYGSAQTRQKLVWTGSHNYTGPALRNHDETLLKIRNDAVYDAYLANWQMMRARL